MGSALAIRQDKKINLEDIERDNLKSEHKVKQEKQEAKAITSTSYVQQQPPPQFTYTQEAPPQYNFLPVKTIHNYVAQQQQGPQQFYNRVPQQQYEVPVVADNSIAQQPNYYGQQQQQYVYLQPYQGGAAQQAEPRATIQYVMYIPAPVAAAASPAAAYVASPKTESLLQSAQEYLNSIALPQAYSAQEYSYDVAAPQRYILATYWEVLREKNTEANQFKKKSLTLHIS